MRSMMKCKPGTGPTFFHDVSAGDTRQDLFWEQGLDELSLAFYGVLLLFLNNSH